MARADNIASFNCQRYYERITNKQKNPVPRVKLNTQCYLVATFPRVTDSTTFQNPHDSTHPTSHHQVSLTMLDMHPGPLDPCNRVASFVTIRCYEIVYIALLF